MNSPTIRASATLDDILSPITREQFIQEYWARAPLFIRGWPDKFLGIFDEIAFDEIMRSDPKVQIYCTFNDYGNARAARHDINNEIKITAEQVDCISAMNDVTLNLNNLEAHDERVAMLAASLKNQLGFVGPVSCKAWRSSVGAGLPLHFDPTAAIVLQLSGVKTWRVSPQPALAFPHKHSLLLPDGSLFYGRFAKGNDLETYDWEEQAQPVADEDLLEFVLRPGDLLYIPAGTWHTTEAIEDTSLALHVHLHHDEGKNTFAEILSQVIKAKFCSEPIWRALPPALDASSARLPEVVSQYFAERLREVRAFLDQLQPDSFALNCAWKELLGLQTVAPSPAAPFAVQPEDRLRFRLPLAYASGQDESGCERIAMYSGAKTLRIAEPELLPFARNLFKQSVFSASEAVGWIPAGELQDWEQAKVLLQDLIDESILERAVE